MLRQSENEIYQQSLKKVEKFQKAKKQSFKDLIDEVVLILQEAFKLSPANQQNSKALADLLSKAEALKNNLSNENDFHEFIGTVRHSISSVNPSLKNELTHAETELTKIEILIKQKIPEVVQLSTELDLEDKIERAMKGGAASDQAPFIKALEKTNERLTQEWSTMDSAQPHRKKRHQEKMDLIAQHRSAKARLNTLHRSKEKLHSVVEKMLDGRKASLSAFQMLSLEEMKQVRDQAEGTTRHFDEIKLPEPLKRVYFRAMAELKQKDMKVSPNELLERIHTAAEKTARLVEEKLIYSQSLQGKILVTEQRITEIQNRYRLKSPNAEITQAVMMIQSENTEISKLLRNPLERALSLDYLVKVIMTGKRGEFDTKHRQATLRELETNLNQRLDQIEKLLKLIKVNEEKLSQAAKGKATPLFQKVQKDWLDEPIPVPPPTRPRRVYIPIVKEEKKSWFRRFISWFSSKPATEVKPAEAKVFEPIERKRATPSNHIGERLKQESKYNSFVDEKSQQKKVSFSDIEKEEVKQFETVRQSTLKSTQLNQLSQSQVFLINEAATSINVLINEYNQSKKEKASHADLLKKLLQLQKILKEKYKEVIHKIGAVEEKSMTEVIKLELRQFTDLSQQLSIEKESLQNQEVASLLEGFTNRLAPLTLNHLVTLSDVELNQTKRTLQKERDQANSFAKTYSSFVNMVRLIETTINIIDKINQSRVVKMNGASPFWENKVESADSSFEFDQVRVRKPAVSKKK